MADEFRRLRDSNGPGGVHCKCCGAIESRAIRSIMDRETEEIIRDSFDKDSDMFICKGCGTCCGVDERNGNGECSGC